MEDRAVTDRNEEQLVTMTVEGQLFGLPILSVQDIVETHNITQVPRTPSAISGIMNLRGRIVTVINLRRILGRSDDSSSRMGVTVEFHGDLYTILVDEIGEVRLLDRSDFEAAPATLDSKLKQLCTGIYRLDGELLAVLDVNQILSAETISQTPPIQFIARRQKQGKDGIQNGKKALPAPANDEPEKEEAAPVAEEEVAEAKPKPAKNLFRKQKTGSSAKPEAKKAAAKAKPATEENPDKPAAKASPAPKAPPKPASPKPAAKPQAEAESDDDAPKAEAVNATDVAPGAPTRAAKSENLLAMIGGDTNLGKIIESFYENVIGDEALADHFAGANIKSQAKAMRTFLATALDGTGAGKNVKAPGHTWLSPKKGLDDEDFNKCLALFEKAMHSQSIPDGNIFRVLAVFEQHRESIVD